MFLKNKVWGFELVIILELIFLFLFLLGTIVIQVVLEIL